MRIGVVVEPLRTPLTPADGGSDGFNMGATSDHSPRIASVLQPGQDVRDTVREPLRTFGGELDAGASDFVGTPVGALSQTQTPQLEAREGFELRLWVSPSLPR